MIHLLKMQMIQCTCEDVLNYHVKYKVLPSYTLNETNDFMAVNIGWRWQIDKLVPMKSSPLELRYTNKGGLINQHAFKGNLANFAQNYLEIAIKFLNTSSSSLESLINTIAINFVGSSHPPIELVKNYRLLYVRKYIITIWLTWLKFSHIGYKDTIMNIHVLNTVFENEIPKPIMISML